jgi:hypothetical protein
MSTSELCRLAPAIFTARKAWCCNGIANRPENAALPRVLRAARGGHPRRQAHHQGGVVTRATFSNDDERVSVPGVTVREIASVGATNVSEPVTPMGGWPQPVSFAAGAVSREELLGTTYEQTS